MKNVYYHVLEGSRYLLADERNKKHLLDVLLAMQYERQWLVYAFCVTDERAYFITEAQNSRRLREETEQALRQFFRRYEGFAAAQERYMKTGEAQEIHTMEELLRYSREVHRIPLECGYVSRVGDYWWSSYITYAGVYTWQMVDCAPLLHYLSENPEDALRRWKRLHKSAPKQELDVHT